LTGIVGAGGGFLIVPALTLLAGVPIKRATSTPCGSLRQTQRQAGRYLGHEPIAWEVAGLFLTLSVVAWWRASACRAPQNHKG